MFALINWIKVAPYLALGQFTPQNLASSAALFPGGHPLHLGRSAPRPAGHGGALLHDRLRPADSRRLQAGLRRLLRPERLIVEPTLSSPDGASQGRVQDDRRFARPEVLKKMGCSSSLEEDALHEQALGRFRGTGPLVRTIASIGPKSGLHFWDPSDALFLEQRIVQGGKPVPTFPHDALASEDTPSGGTSFVRLRYRPRQEPGELPALDAALLPGARRKRSSGPDSDHSRRACGAAIATSTRGPAASPRPWRSAASSAATRSPSCSPTRRPCSSAITGCR